MTKIATVGMGGSTTFLRQAMLLLAVAAITATMVMATADPASAARQRETGAIFACTNGSDIVVVSAPLKRDFENQGFTCTKQGKRQ